MTVIDRLPTSTSGWTAALATAAGGWATAYWVNGWLWDTVLIDLVGLTPGARLTETVHFFLYDTVKIVLLLSGILLVECWRGRGGRWSSRDSPCRYAGW